ncbi:TniQ family protein [Thioclava sp. GXIMD2076]|uniref:TniQ family protein n=1 Tax=Thioclava sp. GXIMD2076 TaxID=3131931 RepID=UPI0030CDC2B8
MLERHLALSVSPFDGETPASIAARLACRNETPPRDLCSDMGLRWPYLCSGHPDQLSLLAEVSGVDLAYLHHWNPEQIGVGRYRIGQMRSTTGVFHRCLTRVCPLCLEEALAQFGRSGAHQLLEWNVLCLKGCERHEVALLELPRAATSHETYDVVTQLGRHQDALRSAADHAAPHFATDFETYVRGRIRGQVEADWMSGLELGQLHGACLTLGAVLAGDPADSLSKLAPEAEDDYCLEGFNVLSSGPIALENCLEALRGRGVGRRSYLSSDLGLFYSWLQSVDDQPEMQDILDCVHQFATRSYTMTPGKTVLGKAAPEIQRISFETARRQSGLGVALIRRLIAHVDLLSEAEMAALRETTPAQLARAVAFWRGLHNLTITAQRLNIAPTQVTAMMDLGLIGHIKFGTALRYAYAADVDQLLAQVSELPVLSHLQGFQSLHQFARSQRIRVAHLVAQWRSGTLDGMVRATDAAGLRGLYVPVGQQVQETKLACREGNLPLLDAAKRLKISAGSVRSLRNAGYLRGVTERNPETNYLHQLISQTSITAFEKHYLTLGQLAADVNKAPIHLARQLDRAGVPTLDCGGGRIRVYDRALVGEF